MTQSSDNESQDLLYVEEAESILGLLFRRYANSDEADQFLLEPIISKAADELLAARLRLFRRGALTTPDELAKLKSLKGSIDNAADFQSIVIAALKLAAYLGAFA
jgi:hypothetical protein